MDDSGSGAERRSAPPTPAGANRPSPPSHTNLASSSRRSPPSTQIIPPAAPSPRRRPFAHPRSPSPPLPPPVPSPLSTPQSSPAKITRSRIPGQYNPTPRRSPPQPSFSSSPVSSTPPRPSIPSPQPAQTPPGIPSPRPSTTTEGLLPRRRSSLSSSHVPEPHLEAADDLAVRYIAAELLQAVKDLSALDERGLPVRGESLVGVLSRRKKESEGRRRFSTPCSAAISFVKLCRVCNSTP